MSVNGVDISQEVGTICGSIWIVFYFALVYFVWTRKPTTLVGRRWKAAWLIGGIPTLGMPFLLPLILLVIGAFQADLSKINASVLFENFPLVFSSLISLIAYTVPLFIPMAAIAILGTYHQFRITSDALLDKIVPPSKDEKPNPIILE